MSELKKGEEVSWNWGGSTVEGKVEKVSPERTTIESKGKDITKNGTDDNPAVVISGAKNPVVKLASELNEVEDEE